MLCKAIFICRLKPCAFSFEPSKNQQHALSILCVFISAVKIEQFHHHRDSCIQWSLTFWHQMLASAGERSKYKWIFTYSPAALLLLSAALGGLLSFYNHSHFFPHPSTPDSRFNPLQQPVVCPHFYNFIILRMLLNWGFLDLFPMWWWWWGSSHTNKILRHHQGVQEFNSVLTLYTWR